MLFRSVTFLGAQKSEVVLREMQQARAFVQHSIRASNGDSEGTPVAILEAAACGLPVIATRHAGISDVVLHEETGLLVDEHDVAGMADHLRTLANKPQYAGELGIQAAKHVRSRYTMAHSINRLSRLLAIAAQNRPLGAAWASINAELDMTSPLTPA